MTDYKLVPVELKELLASMVKLHESKGTVLTVHMHQLREMLAAGADVQGEPVASGWMLFPKAAWDFLCGTGELNGFGFGDRPVDQPPFWWRLVIRKMLDAAPQHAEQQPAPDTSESKAKTPKESWWAGYRAGKGLPANTPRQDAIAAPDVAALVEALEQYADDHNWCYDTCDIGRDVAKKALAARRKRGGA